MSDSRQTLQLIKTSTRNMIAALDEAFPDNAAEIVIVNFHAAIADIERLDSELAVQESEVAAG